MAINGGARPGAGRKPKAEKYAGKINAAEKKIADRLPALIDNMMELANGVTVQEIGKDGEVNVYTRPPDFKANEYLLNRIMGKPTERLEAEVAGPGGGAIPVQVEAAISKVYGTPGDGGDDTEADERDEGTDL